MARRVNAMVCIASTILLGISVAACGAESLSPAAPVAQASPVPQAGPGSPNCNTREEALAVLERRWGETVTAMGITSSGALLEVLASPGGGTWSIIVTIPGGPTCLVSSGEGWKTLAAVPEGPEA